MIKAYTENSKTTIFKAVAETGAHWYDRSGVMYKKVYTRLPTHDEVQEFLDTEKDFETEITAISKNND